MAISSFPTHPALWPQYSSDPRVEPVPAGTTLRLATTARTSAGCDCAPQAPPGGATFADKLVVYLKGRLPPITPLGPPPGDRRLLAEAGVELARFARYPAGITPLGRSPAITLLAPGRLVGALEVLRATWNRLSLAQAMPEGITSLTAYFAPKAGSAGAGKIGKGVPSPGWAAFADAVGTSVLSNVYPPPDSRSEAINLVAATNCPCAGTASQADEKMGGG
jgi:hypothetical protein